MFWPKLVTLVLIGLGESLMILAQIFGARASGLAEAVWPVLKPTNWYLWATLLGSLSIIIGYLYGITVYKNIWLVTLTSWTVIVIVEVLLAWLVFHTVPQGSVLIGFSLVLICFILANI
jgi:hypothetical protein